MNRIHAPDGTPLVYDAYEPERAPPGGGEGGGRAGDVAVLLLHGWADHAGQLGGTAERLRDMGVAAYVLDQRGHGRSGGRPVHLTRFSQLLGDLQAFRRVVRRRRDVPQLLVGHGFGGLIVLRYLETQPGEAPLGAVVANPWLRWRRPSWLSRLAARFADLWPTLATGSGSARMTAGAGAEIGWAQRAVAADATRIESPILFVLAPDDPVADMDAARQFASALRPPAPIAPQPDLGAEAIVAFAASARSSERPRRDD
ncbi:MAG: alpha/beta fold hydrolase [Gemmatimonadales bacterium]|nr:alpha/beta fold hydrolase [Gemmatimonadales bacterium]